MSGRRCRAATSVATLLALLAPPVGAQWLPPAPPPVPLESRPQDCVARFGNPGCAARLYGQLLCSVVGDAIPVSKLQMQLDRLYQQAGIDFSGITAAQVEDLALAQHVPVLCPSRSRQIRDLFAPLASSPAG
ncbi:MAG: hypothetical protein RLZZ137_739 [Cyanobacteriota bacterium]|jgi:hypothetical protein